MLEQLAYLFLDVADFMLLAAVDNADRSAFLAGTARTARAVGIVLNIVGQSVVDDVCQVVHIQSAGCYVSSHQQLYGMLAELLHSQVALLLREIAVQCFGIVAVSNQFVSHLLCLYLGTAEDDGKDAWVVVHQSFQCQILVLGIHHIVDMVHVLGTLVAAAYYNLLVVVQIPLGYALYLAAHGGGEE